MTTTRWWVSALLIFFLQTVVLPFWWQAEVRPDLWLVAVALITLFYGPRHGIWVAALAGVIADMLAANFFGPHLAGYLLLVLPLWLAWSRFQIRWECRFSRCLWQGFSRRLYTIAFGGWGAYRLILREASSA